MEKSASVFELQKWRNDSGLNENSDADANFPGPQVLLYKMEF